MLALTGLAEMPGNDPKLLMFNAGFGHREGIGSYRTMTRQRVAEYFGWPAQAKNKSSMSAIDAVDGSSTGT